jgi:6-phosphofructokinase 1
MSAAVAGAVRALRNNKHTVLGIRNGCEGIIYPTDPVNFSTWSDADLRHLRMKPSTPLGTSRIDPRKHMDKVRDGVRALGIDALIAIGGEDTLGAAHTLYKEGGIPINGVPKTIDDDTPGTDRTFGFDTAVEEATEHILRMWSAGKALGRASIVVLMGRECGRITLHAGHAGGADIILVGEFPAEVSRLLRRIRECYEEQGHVTIAIAESYPPHTLSTDGTREAAQAGNEREKDDFGHVAYDNVGKALAALIDAKLKPEMKGRFPRFGTQVQVPGYFIREGRPLAHDATFAERLGHVAGLLTHNRQFGYMAALRGGKIVAVPLSEATKKTRRVTEFEYDPETMQMRDQDIVRIISDTQESARGSIE